MKNAHLFVDVPPVLDENGQPMDSTVVEELHNCPDFLQIALEISGKKRTYTIAVNLGNVTGASLDALELFKAESYAIFAGAQRASTDDSAVASNQIAEAEVQEKASVNALAVMKHAELRPRERAVYLDLLYPENWEKKPVILGSNFPDMPKDPDECFNWFKMGGIFSSMLMDAVVIAIDPLGPLAQSKKRETQAKQLEAEMIVLLQQKMDELKQWNPASESEVQESIAEEVQAGPAAVEAALATEPASVDPPTGESS